MISVSKYNFAKLIDFGDGVYSISANIDDAGRVFGSFSGPIEQTYSGFRYYPVHGFYIDGENSGVVYNEINTYVTGFDVMGAVTGTYANPLDGYDYRGHWGPIEIGNFRIDGNGYSRFSGPIVEDAINTNIPNIAVPQAKDVHLFDVNAKGQVVGEFTDINGQSHLFVATPKEANSDLLKLRVSGDSYQGDAQFVVKVDGKQVGGVQTAHASHKAGQWDDLELRGDFQSARQVVVEFINDKGAGAGKDRNLYVDHVSIEGNVVDGGDAKIIAGAGQSGRETALWSNGKAAFDFDNASSPTGMRLRISEDAHDGHAQFIIRVDGEQIGDVRTVNASHKQGVWQNVDVSGYFADARSVSVEFVNDVNAGPGKDRNLYIDSIIVDGEFLDSADAVVPVGIGQAHNEVFLWGNGAATFLLDA
ncbi:carbohydrate-binding domain-containing protein [Aureimonas sp. D3]|uniref:carbohydrate-binding domain-containing protein n=1 Tax=Aureimonas sp. D3 TaxID=1638164 RepID=UPI0009E96B8D|nr:carbohydrate-binding domain-containing protein [Aureimonas sp. D3]